MMHHNHHFVYAIQISCWVIFIENLGLSAVDPRASNSEKSGWLYVCERQFYGLIWSMQKLCIFVCEFETPFLQLQNQLGPSKMYYIIKCNCRHKNLSVKIKCTYIINNFRIQIRNSHHGHDRFLYAPCKSSSTFIHISSDTHTHTKSLQCLHNITYFDVIELTYIRCVCVWGYV